MLFFLTSQIFALMDAEDRQGKIEVNNNFRHLENSLPEKILSLSFSVKFADFVLAIGTYCFFGKRDIIK